MKINSCNYSGQNKCGMFLSSFLQKSGKKCTIASNGKCRQKHNIFTYYNEFYPSQKINRPYRAQT